MSHMKFVYILSAFLILLYSCKKESQADIDEEIIQKYLEDNQLDATRHDSGLYYIITTIGNGQHPTIDSGIEVKYKGYLADGAVFDETTGNDTFQSPLSNLIEGWQIGIPLLKEGGKGIFFIPSELGYGSNASGSIPANSVLIFEIELIGIL